MATSPDRTHTSDRQKLRLATNVAHATSPRELLPIKFDAYRVVIAKLPDRAADEKRTELIELLDQLAKVTESQIHDSRSRGTPS